MARLPRIVIPDYPHHVVLRGNNRRALFSHARDYELFFYELGRAQRVAPCSLHAVVLMTNHVHLVITPRDGAMLARFVKHLAQRYSQARNRRRNASGKLFEERYFSKPILTESQLALTLAYVELNPVRAGLVSDASEYRWSTYGRHAQLPSSGFPRGLWTPTSWYVSLGASTGERAVAYAAWVTDCRARDVHPDDVTVVEARAALTELTEWKRLRRPDDSRAA